MQIESKITLMGAWEGNDGGWRLQTYGENSLMDDGIFEISKGHDRNYFIKILSLYI